MRPESGSTRLLLRRLRWTVLRPLARRANGDERSRMSGAGVEFAQVREYQPGDDVRRIDWQLTARSDRAVSSAKRTTNVAWTSGWSST